MKRKLFVAALLGACCNGSIHAQCTITGKVVDAENNEPVAGATVRLRETNIGCTTDDRGAFTLRNVPEGNHVMRVSRLDYTPQTQTVSNNDENVLVRMREDVVSLNQVVVTGTGTHHRLKDSPVPVEVITQKELQQANAANIEDALLKLVPSISFQSTSMSNNIYMNGLSGKYVLVMVNGRKLAGDTSGNIDFSRIDPARVKRIEIISPVWQRCHCRCHQHHYQRRHERHDKCHIGHSRQLTRTYQRKRKCRRKHRKIFLAHGLPQTAVRRMETERL